MLFGASDDDSKKDCDSLRIFNHSGTTHLHGYEHIQTDNLLALKCNFVYHLASWGTVGHHKTKHMFIIVTTIFEFLSHICSSCVWVQIFLMILFNCNDFQLLLAWSFYDDYLLSLAFAGIAYTLLTRTPRLNPQVGVVTEYFLGGEVHHSRGIFVTIVKVRQLLEHVCLAVYYLIVYW